MDINKCTYQVLWLEEDQEYVATVAEFPSLSWLDQAEQSLLDLVAEVVEDIEDSGEVAPTPLGNRRYSGK